MRVFLLITVLFAFLYSKEFEITPKSVKRIKKICQEASGDDVVYLRGGVYTRRFPTIKCSGRDGRYIKITSYPDERVIIKSSWVIKGDFLDIGSLSFVGNNQKLNYSRVIKQWWNPKKELKRGGILVKKGHHLKIHDCAVGYFPASGVKITGKSDYIEINHNIIYNNAWWSIGGTGGLIVKNIHQIDSKKDAKIKITNNLFFSNESRIFSHVFKKGFSKLVIDEGESFLIQQKDDPSKKGAKKGKYSGRYLVENNLILFNGKGTSLNKADNIDFVKNTLYCNGSTTKSIKAGGVRANHSNHDRFLDNAVESCKNRMAFSVVGHDNIFERNFAVSKSQKPINGVKIVDKLFRNPKKLDFYSKEFGSRANKLLDSFSKMLREYNIKVKPTNYVVDSKKMVEDIIKTIPKKSDTVIKRYKDRVEIKNINNSGIKGLGKSFTLKLVP